MGRVSNYWSIGGDVRTDRGKTETIVTKIQGSPSVKPSYAEAESALRSAAHYYLAGDGIVSISVNTISWVPS